MEKKWKKNLKEGKIIVMEEKNDKKEKFDIVDLLQVLPSDKLKFTPKGNKKQWDDAEIVTLGFLVSVLEKKGIKNKELNTVLKERIDNYDKTKYEKLKEVTPISEEQIELEKIKKAKDEININRISSLKKLSPKTKKLLSDAFDKAIMEKSKKANIIIDENDKKEEKNTNENVSKNEKKQVDDMIDIAIKSGVIKKEDLGMK